MTNITGVTTNFFPKTAETTSPMTLASSISPGASIVPITNLAANYSDGDIVVFVIEPTSATNQQVFTGTVASGATQVNVQAWTKGTNVAHTNGVSIVDYVTATDWAMLIKGILTGHNQDGTHKQIAKRETTLVSSATITPNADTTDIFTVTALAAGLTVANPIGTPGQGQIIILRIRDNGTAQTISWGAIYRPVGVALPTTTIISKLLYCCFIYNTNDSKWDLVSVSQEA